MLQLSFTQTHSYTGHDASITVPVSLVYFFAEPSIRKNVLGRGGWLDRVRVGLVDHDRELYLAAYDVAPA